MGELMASESESAEALAHLQSRARSLMARGAFEEAKAVLEEALHLRPSGPVTLLSFAMCCRSLNDYEGALAAADRVLSVNPRAFRALLLKGDILFGRGDRAAAMALLKAGLALAPPIWQLDEPTLQTVESARQVVLEYQESLHRYLRGEMLPLTVKNASSSEQVGRITTFLDLVAGRKRLYRQDPTELYYPGLPATEFYPREQFPWLGMLESRFGAIRQELEEILHQDAGRFRPYITYPDHVPLDQWSELNRSTRWSAVHLIYYGEPVAEMVTRCPVTFEQLAQVSQPAMRNRSPAAMYSALHPRTHIPPHTGVANTRLVTHLPLIVPEGCRFRVGNTIRNWLEGEAWVFDDTIEHEAWNASDQLRVILIFDVWNPFLSKAEKELICAVVEASDRFGGPKLSGSL